MAVPGDGGLHPAALGCTQGGRVQHQPQRGAQPPPEDSCRLQGPAALGLCCPRPGPCCGGGEGTPAKQGGSPAWGQVRPPSVPISQGLRRRRDVLSAWLSPRDRGHLLRQPCSPCRLRLAVRLPQTSLWAGPCGDLRASGGLWLHDTQAGQAVNQQLLQEQKRKKRPGAPRPCFGELRALPAVLLLGARAHGVLTRLRGCARECACRPLGRAGMPVPQARSAEVFRLRGPRGARDAISPPLRSAAWGCPAEAPQPLSCRLPGVYFASLGP